MQFSKRIRNFSLTKRFIALFLVSILSLGFASCKASIPEDDRDLSDVSAAPGYKVSQEATDLVNIVMESGEHIVIELDGETAPKTVANFKSLVAEGFYDGIIFHRVIYGFMVQTGDPTGTGTGGSSKTIEGEFSSNGNKNDIDHKRGVVSMARSMAPNSASSQFFIVHIDSPHLNGDYAAFGHVVHGIETVDQKKRTKTDASDKPVEEQKMLKVFFVTED